MLEPKAMTTLTVKTNMELYARLVSLGQATHDDIMQLHKYTEEYIKRVW